MAKKTQFTSKKSPSKKSNYSKQSSNKQGSIEQIGTVVQELSNGMFKVELDTGHQLICHLSGKIRTNYIRIVSGDQAKIEISPYDLTKGRITVRMRKDESSDNK